MRHPQDMAFPHVKRPLAQWALKLEIWTLSRAMPSLSPRPSQNPGNPSESERGRCRHRKPPQTSSFEEEGQVPIGFEWMVAPRGRSVALSCPGRPSLKGTVGFKRVDVENSLGDTVITKVPIETYWSCSREFQGIAEHGPALRCRTMSEFHGYMLHGTSTKRKHLEKDSTCLQLLCGEDKFESFPEQRISTEIHPS